MTELQRIPIEAEIVEVPSLEEIKSEWTMGASQKLMGQLRQARAAASLEKHYGQGSVEGFAREMYVSPSTVYAYAATWRKLLDAFGEEGEVYGRLENSPLKISNVMEAVKETDIPKALDEAEDEGLSSRQQEARRREKTTPANVETVTEFICPACGEVSPMSKVESREVPR